MSFPCELPLVREMGLGAHKRKQRSLCRSTQVSGLAIFTGEHVTLRLTPGEVDQGIVFKRIDLPSQPKIPARLEYVKGTPRCTMIGHEGVFVQTVEHVLAALSAYSIDNLVIEITGPEVPILDGSALAFAKMIEEAGIQEQQGFCEILRMKSPFFWSQGDVHLIALPSEEYRVSYTLHYPHSSFLRSQYYSVLVNEEKFKSEIAPCRTFSLYEEIAPLVEKGFLKGGGLENGVVIKGDGVLNPEGTRFPDEMVRHKILDVIGDLSLMGPFLAHVIAIRSGHSTNNAFAVELYNHMKMENS